MKFSRVLLVALIFLVMILWLPLTKSVAQVGASSDVKSVRYFYRISRFPSQQPDSTVLRFNLSIPYKSLIFIARDSVYETGIRFSLFLLDGQRNVVFEKSWSRKIKVPSYWETISDSSYYQFSTTKTVLSGNYIVEMEVVDDNIGVPQYNEFKIKVADHRGQKVILGDILLFGAFYDFSQVDYKQMLPSPNNICRSDFTIISEAVLLDSIQHLSAVATWYSKNREIRKDPMIIAQDKEKLTLFLAYPIKGMQPGQFTLQIRLTGRNMKPQTVEMPIEVVKQILFYSEENLNQAIEQMNYIGEGASWDSLKDASDYEKKQYWFSRFWQDYYPTVDSMNNPVQEEYFRRVQFTNREFGNGMEGWRTDRGRIFLIYGQPDEVQESVNAMMRNYQIWTYQKLKKQFIFIDEHGNGYYRLTQEL